MTQLPSFLGLPNRLDGERAARAMIFGAGHGSAYPGRDSLSASAPAVSPGPTPAVSIRRSSAPQARLFTA